MGSPITKFGINTHRQHQFLNATLRPRAPVVTPHSETLRDHLADLAPRIERRNRILKDHLQVRTKATQFLTLKLGEIMPLIVDGAPFDVVETNDRLRHGRLAATRLTHNSERFAFRHVERNTAHGVNHSALTDRELDFKISHRQ